MGLTHPTPWEAAVCKTHFCLEPSFKSSLEKQILVIKIWRIQKVECFFAHWLSTFPPTRTGHPYWPRTPRLPPKGTQSYQRSLVRKLLISCCPSAPSVSTSGDAPESEVSREQPWLWAAFCKKRSLVNISNLLSNLLGEAFTWDPARLSRQRCRSFLQLIEINECANELSGTAMFRFSE